MVESRKRVLAVIAEKNPVRRASKTDSVDGRVRKRVLAVIAEKNPVR